MWHRESRIIWRKTLSVAFNMAYDTCRRSRDPQFYVVDFIEGTSRRPRQGPKDRKHVILEAENIDGLVYEDLDTKSISGWAYDFGKGRVVFTAGGHIIHAMWAPEYSELQRRSVQ